MLSVKVKALSSKPKIPDFDNFYRFINNAIDEFILHQSKITATGIIIIHDKKMFFLSCLQIGKTTNITVTAYFC